MGIWELGKNILDVVGDSLIFRFPASFLAGGNFPITSQIPLICGRLGGRLDDLWRPVKAKKLAVTSS